MNRDWGGENGDPSVSGRGRTGEDESNTWGGADIDFLDFRGATFLRRTGDGRMGEDDSAPDWKILLSSHPLSSA